MESIKINRPVNIKVKVTETYKKRVAMEIQDTIRRLDMELKQLEFHGKRMIAELEKQNPKGILKAREHIQKEEAKRLEAREKLTLNLREIAQLANGAEVLHDTIDSVAEVKIGDDWNQVMGMEIVLCDEKVIEIRPNKGFRESLEKHG